MRLFLVVLSIAVVLSSGAWAVQNVERPWLEPSDQIVSPCIKWAKPLQGGPVKVLFITYRGGMREIVEICERIDISREVFCTDTQDRYAVDMDLALKGTTAAERDAALKTKLESDFDVIVVGNISKNALPDWAWKAILGKVEKGCGLLAYIKGEPPEALSSTLARAAPNAADEPYFRYPFKGLPAFSGNADYASFLRSTCRFGTLGKGRAVLLTGYHCPLCQMLAPGTTDPGSRS